MTKALIRKLQYVALVDWSLPPIPHMSGLVVHVLVDWNQITGCKSIPSVRWWHDRHSYLLFPVITPKMTPSDPTWNRRQHWDFGSWSPTATDAKVTLPRPSEWRARSCWITKSQPKNSRDCQFQSRISREKVAGCQPDSRSTGKVWSNLADLAILYAGMIFQHFWNLLTWIFPPQTYTILYYYTDIYQLYHGTQISGGWKLLCHWAWPCFFFAPPSVEDAPFI